jgi:hypothetical protein
MANKLDHSLLSYLKGRVDWSIKAKVGVTLTRDRAVEILDALLNECHEEAGECSKCGEICCPYKDTMHFHHDGCPSCTVEAKAKTTTVPAEHSK